MWLHLLYLKLKNNVNSTKEFLYFNNDSEMSINIDNIDRASCCHHGTLQKLAIVLSIYWGGANHASYHVMRHFCVFFMGFAAKKIEAVYCQRCEVLLCILLTFHTARMLCQVPNLNPLTNFAVVFTEVCLCEPPPDSTSINGSKCPWITDWQLLWWQHTLASDRTKIWSHISVGDSGYFL